MTAPSSKFRFLLINAFSLAPGSTFLMRAYDGPKEAQLHNYADVAPFLADVDWDLDPGALATHGNWPVETKQEFLSVGANRLPLVREACASGRYNAIVLLGGGDPGYMEAREIGRSHGIAVTSCAHAQMHVAGLLGNRFSIVDVSETHNMQMYHLVVQYRMTDRCASIRNINFPLPKPNFPDEHPIHVERDNALRGEPSAMLDAAVAESIAAIEEDGADVIILGCSAAYWMQPLLQKRLHAIGWDIPVLEGYRCAIEVAKTLVGLGVDASGLAFPGERPAKWRRKKVF
jgi:Asp/Glu/hydantoin racemase